MPETTAAAKTTEGFRLTIIYSGSKFSYQPWLLIKYALFD